MKKHTRKEPCVYCGVACGSAHRTGCPAIELLTKQGRNYDMKWLSVPEYAQKMKKSKAQIYLDIRTRKISEDRVRKAIKKIEVLEIKVIN